MRVAVVSDTHMPRGSRKLPPACLARLAAADLILHARFPGCGAVVYGHTHLPQVARFDGIWILNPGSPTDRRRAPTRTMLELTVSGREIMPRLVEFDP
ncbi:MAG TPA: metallophosphoesterase family protein [Gaiellaceae bacterium]|nr:metallophosphoesterase family protein [Gaiellaceae bacterium]